MNEEIIIQTCDLSKVYGDKIAVSHLNLEIHRGEVFGLLGPNGAGKTTTTLMLQGLTEPTDGKAYIKGIDCTRDALKVKRIVGYLPDNVGFYSDMTGRENLYFTGRLNGLAENEIKARAQHLLERVGMSEAADRKAGTYSRGMKQRLGIADALMKDPEIIIMDEPTLGIDPQGMKELLQLIRDLSEKDGRTILISSHQLYQVQQVCDRVGLFVGGKLIAAGTIEELGRQMESAGKYSLELSAEPDDGVLEPMLKKIPGVEQVEKEGDLYIIRSGMDLRRQVVMQLAANGFTILQLRQKGGDLDEIYSRYFEAAEDQEHVGRKVNKLFAKQAK